MTTPTPSYKLSNPSKMPGRAFPLQALDHCPTGARLAQVPGSVCHGCYATRGNYRFGNVKRPRIANGEWLKHCLDNSMIDRWVAGMVASIEASAQGRFFRWHDSGDLLNLQHLEAIARVCEALPHMAFWLPTREYAVVQDYLFNHGSFPANLVVRLSAHMIGRTLEPACPLPTSSVDAGTGWQCPASHNPAYKGNCNECRACWSADVGNVDYRKH